MRGKPLPDAEQLLLTLTEQMRPDVAPDTGLIGIHTGGVWVAERLHRRSTRGPARRRSTYRSIGTITRSSACIATSSARTFLSRSKRALVLVDDVLYTGRTIRAAMNELFDYGRPASIRLAALIDRGGRELPIAAQWLGATIEVPRGEIIELKRLEAGRLALSYYQKD